MLIVSRVGLPWALISASVAIVVLSLPMLLLHEPPRDFPAALNAHRPALLHALRRPEIRHGMLLMLLSGMGVRLTLSLFGPFLLDKGLSMEQLGWFFSSVFMGAGIGGALAGGLLVRIAPGWRAVWIAVAIKGCALAALALVAPYASLTMLMALIVVVFAALGFVWVALYSALMGLTSPLQSGVDFTLFQSADALLAVVGGICGGLLAQHLGYHACFALAAASAFIAVMVVRRQSGVLDRVTARQGEI